LSETKKKITLAARKAALAKKYNTTIGSLSEVAKQVDCIPTGNIAIDHILGGGFPRGRLIELYGPPSSGKSTIALQAAAEFQRRAAAGDPGYAGKSILYMDHENAMDPAYAKALGLDIDSELFLFAQPDSLEDSANISRELVASGEIGLAIYYSVAAMIPQASLDAETGKASVALQARGIAEFLKPYVRELYSTDTTAIFLNHLAEVIDMGGGGRPGIKRYTTPGGRALKFFSSVRVEFHQIGNITEEVYDDLTNDKTKQVMATNVRVKVVKNKVAPPFKQATVRVRYGKGFDQAYSAFDLLLKYKKVIAAGGGWFYFDRMPSLAEGMPQSKDRPALRGLSAVLRYAEENPGWADEMRRLAVECLKSSPDDEQFAATPVLEDEDDLEEEGI
jgi:recombination protein RecA